MKVCFIISLLLLANSICFSQSFNSQKLDSLFQVLNENNKFMGSIAVSHNGRLLYAKTIGYSDIENTRGADINTTYRVGSISKMFTAVLVLKAVEEKKIVLNQPLDKYFPEIKNSGKITIGHLLGHKTGIHDFTNDKSYADFNSGARSEKQVIGMIAKGKSEFEPGSAVEYSNSNYIVLSYILEKIYRKPYASILNAKIVAPLGLKHTYFGSKINNQKNESYSYHFMDKWTKGPETDLSIPMGAGSIVSNPTDLATFIEQLFKGKIVSQKTLSAMKTVNEYHGIGIGMGLLMFTHAHSKSYGHNGAIDDFRSLLNFFPGENLSIAITSNGINYSIDSVLSCALSSYLNKPFSIPNFNAVALDPGTLNLYAGEYASAQVPFKITITKKENKLFGQVKGQPAFPLEASTTNVFRFEEAGLILEFDATKKQMTLKQGGQELLFTKE
jgi:CubicO group peptidase (beta-lactamase class C family)